MLERLGAAALLASCALSCGDARHADLATVETRQGLSAIEVSTGDPAAGFVSYRGRSIWGARYDLPVGPRSGATPPAEWGICGITKLSGSSDASSVLRIMVGPDGRYQVLIGVGHGPAQRLDARVSCAKMSAFLGLPAAASAHTTREYTVGRADVPEPAETLTFRKVYANGGNASDLCFWSGFEGDVSSIRLDDLDSFLFSGSRFDAAWGWSVDAISFGTGVRDFTSYARCDGYTQRPALRYSDPLQGWQSDDYRGVFSQYRYGDDTFLPATPATHFCWLTGISTFGPTLHAELRAAKDPASGAWSWLYEGKTTSTMAGVQCLAYEQSGSRVGFRGSARRDLSAPKALARSMHVSPP